MKIFYIQHMADNNKQKVN